MTYLRNRIKTQRNVRKDGRVTITLKLIGYTEGDLEELSTYLISNGHADEERQRPGASLAADVGGYIGRAISEPKPHEQM